MTEAWDGYPEGRERDGWHWLSDDYRRFPLGWDAASSMWHSRRFYQPHEVSGLWRYLGPCALPGEDRAAWLKGWEAAREAALSALGYGGSLDARWNLAGLAEDLRKADPVGFRTAERVEKQICAAIRAMEPPA